MFVRIVNEFGYIILKEDVIFTICVLAELMSFLDDEIDFLESIRLVYFLGNFFSRAVAVLYRLEEHYTFILKLNLMKLKGDYYVKI